MWANSYYNFDHLGNALTSLFITLTIDGYKVSYCMWYSLPFQAIYVEDFYFFYCIHKLQVVFATSTVAVL